MSPQFVDFNADGTIDIVAATWEGVVYVVKGTKAGWAQPEIIRDAKGEKVTFSHYYEFENDIGYTHTKRTGIQAEDDHLISALAYDWDSDGDYDLLLGAKNGKLYLQKNEGTNGTPKFTGKNVMVKAGATDFIVPGGMTAPRLVDWDKDGIQDLVCGSFEGGVFYYRNTGKKGAPRFASPEMLIDVVKTKNSPSEGVYADPVDFDGDGDLDLLVGGYATWVPDLRPLTAKQQKKLAELRSELEKAEARMLELRIEYGTADEGLTAAERIANGKKLIKNEEFTTLAKRVNEIRPELAILERTPKREAGVWLYRNRGPVK